MNQKKLFVYVVAIFLAIIWIPSTALATTITFQDNSVYWPTWISTDTSDNSNDDIGVPEILDINAGQLTHDGTNLLSISFNYSPFNNTNVSAGDLFLDMDSDGAWDWFVDVTSTATLYQVTSGTFSASKGPNDSAYLLSDSVYPVTNASIRNDHPVEVNLAGLGGTGIVYSAASWVPSFTDFTNDGTGNSPVLFANLNIQLIPNSDITVGFGPNCANDVIYEQIPVPEPGTMLLFGCGLIIVAGIGRKRLLNR